MAIIREGFLEEEDCDVCLIVGEVRAMRRCWGDTGGGRGSLQGETGLTGLSFPFHQIILALFAVTCGPKLLGGLACLLLSF